MAVKFPVGDIVITPAAMNVFTDMLSGSDALLSVLMCHARGDWGALCAQDKKTNDLALVQGGRLMSAYDVGGAKIWIITEADRSVTTVLLPSDY